MCVCGEKLQFEIRPVKSQRGGNCLRNMRFLCLHGMGTNSAILEAQIGERFFLNSNILIRSLPTLLHPRPLLVFFFLFLLPSCERLISGIWQTTKDQIRYQLGPTFEFIFLDGQINCEPAPGQFLSQFQFSSWHAFPTGAPIPSFIFFFLSLSLRQPTYIPSLDYSFISLDTSYCVMNPYLPLTITRSSLPRYLQYLPRSLPKLLSLSPVCGRYGGGSGASH